MWFVYLSFQNNAKSYSKILWTIASLLFQPIAGILFFFVKKVGLIPMILAIIATLFYGLSGTSSETFAQAR